MTGKFAFKTEWLIFIGFLLFYILLPNNIQGFDSYSYSISIRNGSDLFHPHHLIYNLFGYIVYSIFSFTGLGSLKIMSLANSVFAAFALMFLYKIIKHKSGQKEAVIGTIFTGFVFTFRYYATSVEVNMPAVFFLILALYYLFVKNDKPLSPWLVYLLLCAGMLFHQIVALIGIPILIYDMLRHKSAGRALKYAHPGILAGALIYVLVAIERAAEKNAVGIYHWITKYGQTGAWGKLGLSNIKNAVWGKMKTLYGGEIVREIFYKGEWSTIGIIIIAVMVLIFLTLAYLFIRSLLDTARSNDNIRWLLLALVAVSGLFAFWWAPADDGFWLYPVIFYMIFIFSMELKNKMNRLTAIAMTALLIILNTSCEFIPSSDKNNSHVYQGAKAFERLALTGNDLVITSHSQMRLAYEYYTGIHVPTTCMMFLPLGDKDRVFEEYHQRINDALETGRVIMFEDEIRPDSYRSYLFDRFTIREYEDVYAPYLDYLLPVDSVSVHGKVVKLYQLQCE